MDKKSYCIAWLMLLFVGSLHAQYRTTTYCNPLNLDYTYPFHNSHLGKSYRSGADPAVVEFRGEYYMFVTRSWGYWHSKDLLNWDFITPENGISRVATPLLPIIIRIPCSMFVGIHPEP